MSASYFWVLADIILLTAFFLISLLYSSVGHGGASGYLALMALYAFSPQEIRSSALFLNLFVSGIAFFQFIRKKHFSFKIFISVAVTSIPLAYFGGKMNIDARIYKEVLGVLLFLASLNLFRPFFSPPARDKNESFIPLFLLGGAIGFLSGIMGIGGGIILSPLLIVLHYADSKITAGVSALFIFVNSLAGFIGLGTDAIRLIPQMPYILIGVLTGGLIGSYLGARQLSRQGVKSLLAVVLLVASFKLIFL